MSDGFDERFECSRGGPSQRCFELGKHLFDRIEVGAVGRQIAQRRAGSLDYLPDTSDFVRWQIVHDDNIALAQRRREKMFDISTETCAVHRPIEHAGRGDLIMPQGADECRRHPMTMRRGGFEASPARGPAIEPRHIGLRPSFINEDKMLRVQTGLARTPFLTRLGDIGAILFGSAQ